MKIKKIVIGIYKDGSLALNNDKFIERSINELMKKMNKYEIPVEVLVDTWEKYTVKK